jgi:FkbM family methyltransferase
LFLKNLFYKLIYNSKINFFLRSITYPLLKEKTKLQLPPSGTITVKTASGSIKIATNQTSHVTKLLYWNGYEKFEYSLIFEKLISEVSVFFDIGANFGYYSILASKANSRIKTYAFEPAIGPKYFLKKNIELNNFSKSITLIEKALSNQNGKINFFEVQNKKYDNLLYNLSGEHNAGTKTKNRDFIKNSVESITLNDFIISKQITNIDLIKIDTEGTEIEILKSGKAFIEKFEPIIICETLYNETEIKLDAFFKNLNYNFYNHTPKGLKKTNTIIRKNDNGIRNCFFVPNSKINLILEFVV